MVAVHAWQVGMFRNEWTERLEEVLTENTISLRKDYSDDSNYP